MGFKTSYLATNKFKLIKRTVEIKQINNMLKPFFGLVENLIYQK